MSVRLRVRTPVIARPCFRQSLFRAMPTICACVGGSMLLAQASAVPAAAQTYPARQITIVVPYPPAGTPDVVARIIADGLGAKLKQPVIVFNKVGGGGSVGIGDVVRANPDGYTLLMGNDGSNAILPFVDPNFKFDPIRDLVPIAMPAEYAHAFLVNAKTPAKTMSEFVAYAKSQPGKLTFGTPGYGSVAQVATELLMQQTGTDMIHVPYRGSAQALTDLIAGMITLNMQSMSGVIPQISNPSIRILAATGKAREPALPDVPTMLESGFAEFLVTSWLGVLAPAGTPRDIQEKLGAAIIEVAQSPEAQKTLRALGFQPGTLSGQAFSAFYKSEVEKWKRIVAERGIKLPG